MKTATISARIDPELKANAEKWFKQVGLSTSEAITLFYSQVTLHHGLPFEVKVPNEETIESFNEDISSLPKYSSVDDAFASLDM